MNPRVPVFGEGSRGPKVADLHERLERAGFVVPDDERGHRFGSLTSSTVRAFQQSAGLTADGIVGPETWDALVAAGYHLGDRLLYHRAPMLRGNDVSELQSRLNSIGFDAGRVDGIFGPETAEAVAEFQRNAGVVADGVVGPEALRAISLLGFKAEPVAAGSPVEHLRSPLGIDGRKIVLDPRGGLEESRDEPATQSGLTEGQAAMAVCEELSLQLRQLGAIPMLSRGAGESPTGEERSAVANSVGADLVVSVGFNWLPDTAPTGVTCHYFSLGDRESEAGRRLATLCLEELVDELAAADCRIHGRSWSILRCTRAPSVVVEPLFLSNADAAALIEGEGGSVQIAGALARAIERYFTSDGLPPSAE